MPPQVRTGVLRPCPDWNDESDLTDLTDSEVEEEVQEQAPQRKQGPPPPPPEDKGDESPSSRPRPGRTTRQATQKLADEDMGAVNDRDQRALPEYKHTPTKVDDVYEWMSDNLVDICPDYQRDVVWSDAKQMNLIDSIFNNYPVPNLVFMCRRLPNGDIFRVCIDGKQRMTSIKRFMDGEIYWKDPATKKKLWFKKTQPNQRRTVLEDWQKRQFRRAPLTIYDYTGITLNQERMIFQRVQLGTVLTPAERLQAVNGVCASLVREIREHIRTLTVFGEISEWGSNRGRDFLALSQIVYLVKGGKLPATLPEPDKLTPFLEGKVGDVESLRDGIKHSFTIFARLLSHPVYAGMLAEKEISPVEFVVGVYAISVLKKRLPDSSLADALKKIWGNAREKSTAKRKATKSSSIKAYGDMRNFLERVLGGKIQLERDPAETLAAVDVPSDYGLDMGAQHEEVSKVEASPSTSRKRSRAQTSRDADDDDGPPTKAKTERKPSAPKKQKLAHRAKQEANDSDDDMDSDGSAEIVRSVPKRAVASGSTIKKPSQVGNAPTTSPATTRVKRQPANAVRCTLPKSAGASSKASTSATVKKPTANASSSRIPEDRKVLRPTAPRSSSTQSFATAFSSNSPRNTPGASSASTVRPAQPRSVHTTPSTGHIALPPLSTPDLPRGSSYGPNSAASSSGSTNRMERLQMLKHQSKPDSQSATPPSQHSGPKLPTPAPDEPMQKLGSLPPLTRNAIAQPAAGSSRLPPPPWQTPSASPIAGMGSNESALGTLQAKKSDLSGLRFSKHITQKADVPTLPLPSRAPGTGLPVSSLFEPAPPPSSSNSPVAQQSAPTFGGGWSMSSAAGFGMERRGSGARTLPTPPASSSSMSYIRKEGPWEGGYNQ